MTPIKCFRVRNNALYIEDWAGNREIIFTAISHMMFEFAAQPIIDFHKRPLLAWDVEYKQ